MNLSSSSGCDEHKRQWNQPRSIFIRCWQMWEMKHIHFIGLGEVGALGSLLVVGHCGVDSTTSPVTQTHLLITHAL